MCLAPVSCAESLGIAVSLLLWPRGCAALCPHVTWVCTNSQQQGHRSPPKGTRTRSPPTAYLLVGHRKLEGRGSVAQGEYVSELDGGRYGSDVVGRELLGRAPLEPVRGGKYLLCLYVSSTLSVPLNHACIRAYHSVSHFCITV